MTEAIQDPQLRAFVHSHISKSFGLSVDTIANKCKNWGRFKAWLSSDVNRIKKVLNIVKDEGVSPAFFAAYERTEGYNSKWGWLNHTSIKGSPEEDARITARWIVSQSQKTTDNPAWIDYANFKDFVPEDVKQAGNADFQNMTVGSIGRVVIPGTAAATWEVYYPNGLLKEYNGVQNYAKPITLMMNTILEWGGELDNNDPDPSNPPVDPDPDPGPDPPSIDFGLIKNFFSDFSETMIKKIEEMLIVNLYDYGKSKTFGNSFLKVDKTYSNTYKIKPTLKFNKIIEDLISEAGDNLTSLINSINPDREPDPEENVPDPVDPGPEPEPDDDMYFPVDYTAPGINFWYPPYTKGSVQEAMDFGGPRTGGRIHAGYDIGGGGVRGHKVYAIRSGRVTFVGNEGTRGFVIRIKHTSDNKHSMYMHLVVNSNTVKVGDYVKAGQQIAVMGDTPNGMYSIHLHVEIDETGEFKGYEHQINPREYLQVTGNNKTNLPNPAKK